MKWPRCVLQACPVLPQDVQHQLLALEEAQLLSAAVTSFAYAADGWLERLVCLGDGCLGGGMIRRLYSRRLLPRLARRVRSLPWAELLQRWAQWRHAARKPATTDAWFEAVDRAAARRIRPGIRLAIAREDACLATFAAARAVGGRCLYLLPTAYYTTVRQVLEREYGEFPGVASHTSLAAEYEAGRCRRKEAEVAAAEHILVASRYIADSLAAGGVRCKHLTVIPYGCEPKRDPRSQHGACARSNVVLYVGGVSLRKGIPRLLRAWKRLGAYRTHRLRLIGSLDLNSSFLSDFLGFFEYVPRLPRSELAAHYARAYAFVFPSACDGFGLVLNEALSYGLPVIASANTGAPGFITHGAEGFIYPFGDDDQLCASLDRLLSRPEERAEMGRAAYHLAQGWTWTHYRGAFRGLVRDLIETRPPVRRNLPQESVVA